MSRRQFCPSFAGIAFALHWEPGELVLTLVAYLDESGHPAEDIPLAVAGCVATYEAWREFEAEWLQVLKAFGVSWFHAVDLEHSRGEFVTWKGDRQRREGFVDTLFQVIGRHAFPPVACLVPSHEVKTLRSRRPRRKRGESANERAVHEIEELAADPYCVAFAHCMKAAAEKIAAPRNEDLHIVPAYRDNTAGKIARLVEIAQEVAPFRDRIASVTIGRAQSPRRIPQLQAADLVAYEVARSPSWRPIRSGFRQLRGLRMHLSKADPARIFEGWLEG